MFAMHLSSNYSFELQASLSEGEAHGFLRRWRANATRLGFGYFRSLGGVMQTGSGTLLRVTAGILIIDTQGSRLAAVLKNARYSFGNLGMMTPDFQAIYDIEGLSIALANHDCLYMFEDSGEVDPTLLLRQFERLR